jgi:L-asparagine transporter-like permease
MISNLVDACGVITGGFMVSYLGPRKSFVISFTLVAIGALLLILLSQFYEMSKDKES